MVSGFIFQNRSYWHMPEILMLKAGRIVVPPFTLNCLCLINYCKTIERFGVRCCINFKGGPSFFEVSLLVLKRRPGTYINTVGNGFWVEHPKYWNVSYRFKKWRNNNAADRKLISKNLYINNLIFGIALASLVWHANYPEWSCCRLFVVDRTFRKYIFTCPELVPLWRAQGKIRQRWGQLNHTALMKLPHSGTQIYS